MEQKVGLWQLPFPSTQLEDVVFAENRDGSVSLLLERLVGGRANRTQLRFVAVRAFRHRAESHCTVWHIDAYDVVTEVCDSEWVGELLEAMPDDLRELFEMRHFVLYLDSFGCYEVVAGSWVALPETPVELEST